MLDGMSSPEATAEVLSALLDRLHALNRTASARIPGHSATFYRVIGLLQDVGAMRVGDLAAAVHLSQPGMTKTVHQLEGEGFVTRGADPEDSRATLVEVSEAGMAALAQRKAAMVETVLPTFGSLTNAERRTLQDAADVLTHHMTAALPQRARQSHPQKELA